MVDFIIKKDVLLKYSGRASTIVIPDSVTEIGESAFRGCSSLTIRATDGSYAKVYAKENAIPFTADKHADRFSEYSTSEIIGSVYHNGRDRHRRRYVRLDKWRACAAAHVEY